MGQPTYDIVIFGASGSTGKYVVREALKFLDSPNSPFKTLALAGRNSSKLVETLKWASSTSHPTIPLLVADTSDPPSLRHMASQAKLVLNCVGPFRLHGEPVVAACVEAGCDYLDICGEPEFMERMEELYYEKAVEMGSLVVSACASVSVISELGMLFHSMQWVSPAVPNRVQAYATLESDKRLVGSFATFESVIMGVANARNLTMFRSSRKRARLTIPGYAPPKEPTIEYQEKFRLWATKLPTSDATVVRRTFSMLTANPSGLQGVNENSKRAETRVAFWSKIKPAHFGVKIASKSLTGILQFNAVWLLIGLLGRFPIGKWLMLNFPSFFSLGYFRKNDPTDDEIASTSFKMLFLGQGFSDVNHVSEEPDTEIVTRVTGPEAGFVTTSIILVQSALIILQQREDLPKGGVFTPGIVFGPTDLQDRLQENGVSFDLISKS